MSNRKRPLSVVTEDQEEDVWEGERTTPGWAQRVTVGDLYRALARLETVVGHLTGAVKWMAVSVAALALTTGFLWFLR